MPYTVEITIANPPATTEDEAPSMYQLPDEFDTIADAKAAAADHIAGLACDPATVLFHVQDREGLTVATNSKPRA